MYKAEAAIHYDDGTGDVVEAPERATWQNANMSLARVLELTVATRHANADSPVKALIIRINKVDA